MKLFKVFMNIICEGDIQFIIDPIALIPGILSALGMLGLLATVTHV